MTIFSFAGRIPDDRAGACKRVPQLRANDCKQGMNGVICAARACLSTRATYSNEYRTDSCYSRGIERFLALARVCIYARERLGRC